MKGRRMATDATPPIPGRRPTKTPSRTPKRSMARWNGSRNLPRAIPALSHIRPPSRRGELSADSFQRRGALWSLGLLHHRVVLLLEKAQDVGAGFRCQVVRLLDRRLQLVPAKRGIAAEH